MEYRFRVSNKIDPGFLLVQMICHIFSRVSLALIYLSLLSQYVLSFSIATSLSFLIPSKYQSKIDFWTCSGVIDLTKLNMAVNYVKTIQF